MSRTASRVPQRASIEINAIKQTLTQRALALAMAIALITTLAATQALIKSSPHPAEAAGSLDSSNSLWPLLVADETPLRLPARGAGAADTTAADPAAAGAAAASSSAKLTGSSSVPATALAAYRKAASRIAVSDPSCHLTWTLLAGIGKVETDHGRSWGAAAHVTKSGDVVPTILGPILDGTHDTATLLDTDGGAYDHNRRYDRAVGPMQFVPATWRSLGRDGNGDGIKDPNNFWDATLAAGGYLCNGNRDLSDPAQRRAAILSYNPSSAYVAAVLAWASAYQKAGDNLPALEGVPDPLVLGSGGELGEDPFGDATGDEDALYADGSVPDESGGYAGETTDESLAALAGQPASVGVNSVKPTASPTPKATPKATRTAAKPTRTPSPSPTPTSTPSASASVSAAASASASASMSPTPWVTPTQTPWLSPSPTPSVTPTATPDLTPTPSPDLTPTPSPTPDPTPSATPTVSACATGITAQGSASATPVDWTGDGSYDALRVSVPVSVPVGGNYTAGVRLTDANGWRVTSTVASVSLSGGTVNLVVELAGGDIGDAGASGPMSVRVTIRGEGAAASCATPLLDGAGIGAVNAASYAGYNTSVARLRSRLDNAISVGRVSGQAATDLPTALNSPNPQSPDLFHFRFVLMSVQSVTAEERARLDSLAARRMNQGSDFAGPTSYNDATDPGYDGVG